MSALAIGRRELLAGTAACTLLPLSSGYLLAQTPKRGGRFRLGVLQGDTGETLDPSRTAGAQGLVTQLMVRSALVEILPNGQLGPELAESWEADHGFQRWTFKLRRGVQFHNGKTFDANDVLFSIRHHIGEGSKSAMRGVLSVIKELKAADPYTVVVELAAGNADFVYVFGDYAMRIIADGTQDFRDAGGTGPYKIEQFEPGGRVFAKRYPNYFKSDRAHFDEVTVIVIPDESARIAALRGGEIDAMDRITLKTAPLAQRLPGVKLLEIAGRQHFSLPMLTDQDPYNNNDVRLALKYAIDREEILNNIINGRGSLGNDHPIASDNRFFAKDLPQRKYDPDKAKFHLKKVGFETHTFKLHVADAAFAGAVDLGALYQEEARKAGINIELVRESNDGYWSKVWRKAPWCAAYWSGRPTEDWMLTSAYSADAAWNDTNWKHRRFNEVLVAARSESDPKKRADMYAELQALISNEGGVVIPVFANYVSLTTDKVAYGQVSSMWVLDGYKATERWWFA
jgi:peptide/nickel transport system substrate-binding protein